MEDRPLMTLRLVDYSTSAALLTQVWLQWTPSQQHVRLDRRLWLLWPTLGGSQT